ncbi:NRDE family protein [Nocardia suismassiliense]|uniref:hypothetical protein n=1 Tax=Nocardia suismassiliense TaxID=2077092 RepID=UPI000D1E8755|nr:hypothetical protein [Nocardia suismassiliense]
MSTCLFLLDSRNARFVAIESRDQSIHRPHGYEAARKLGLAHRFSYGPHWFANPSLRDRVFTIRDAGTPVPAEVVGGLDIDGGSWLAFHRGTGVYCRIFADTAIGDEFVAASGLPMDCVTADSARDAVQLLETRLLPALDGARRMPGFHLVIADSSNAFVVTFDGRDTVAATSLAADRPHVLTETGAAADDEFSKHLQSRAEGVAAPTENLPSWGPWVSVFAGTDADAPDYSDESWLANRHSAIRPPYRDTDDTDRYKNVALRPVTDPSQVAWTKSVTIYSAGRTGAELFAYNERQLFDYQPLPTDVHKMGFPTTTDDFFVVIANENS